ncbi:hypothetical protein A3835_06080 [Campylobacter concisus]|uniref:Uncharacterized protein n=1 Tax=Campylobacter concisus TaxID=199 RepID=A0A1X0U107_9BACT|nr:hypothetical protein A3835_06080 [Campylobacter concisus]
MNGILKFAPQYKLIKNYAKRLNFYDITFSYKFPLSLLFQFGKALSSSKSPKSAYFSVKIAP